MLKGMHINDSLKGAGSRVDRHAPIGRGELGSSFFGRLMSDSTFRRRAADSRNARPIGVKMEIDWLGYPSLADKQFRYLLIYYILT